VRAINTIFRRELAAYLYSPMGYVISAAVLLIGGLLFYAEALGPAAGERLSAEVLMRHFYNMSGLVVIAGVALSVRLIAEERQARTLPLLRTAPLGDWQIVLGKFLAAFTFLAGMTVLSLYMPLLVLVNGKISFGQIAVGYLGLFLIGASALAMGTFATALTRSYLLAVVIGTAVTSTMFLFWPLARVVDPPLTGVFTALGLHGLHFYPFQIGVLHVRDVVYYLAITYFFLLAAAKVMEAKRWE
jgi:gliding motility-associated transport system permease protein